MFNETSIYKKITLLEIETLKVYVAVMKKNLTILDGYFRLNNLNQKPWTDT